MKISLLALLFFTSFPALAQPTPTRYRIKIVTFNGERLRGTLYAVDEARLQFSNEDSFPPLDPESVPLESIRKVLVYPNRRREAAWQGAAVGGALLGFVTLRSLQKHPPRSSVVFGLNLALGTGAGALFGNFVGSGISRRPHNRVIRPARQGDASASLLAQLRPFCIRNQDEYFTPPPQ